MQFCSLYPQQCHGGLVTDNWYNRCLGVGRHKTDVDGIVNAQIIMPMSAKPVAPSQLLLLQQLLHAGGIGTVTLRDLPFTCMKLAYLFAKILMSCLPFHYGALKTEGFPDGHSWD